MAHDNAQFQIIDTDTHVTEAPDLWTSRAPRKWGDDLPHVRWVDKLQAEAWVVGDKVLGPAWMSANWGWNGPPLSCPPRLSDAHPAAYDARERLKIMDEGKIFAAVLYPNLGLRVGATLRAKGEPQLALDCIRAYNDSIIEWTSPAPERFAATGVLPVWDIGESVKEIARIAGLGHRGICTTAAPEQHGSPPLASRAWDPVWAAAQEAGLSINFHVGGGVSEQDALRRAPEEGGMRRNYANIATVAFLENGMCLSSLLNSGILPRFPKLKFVVVESGVGWIPFVLEAVNYHFEKARVWEECPEFTERPDFYFHRQVYINYWFEKLEKWHVDAIGADNMLFETDFPHPTCIAGQAITQAVDKGLSGWDKSTREKILWRNAADLYHLEMPLAQAA